MLLLDTCVISEGARSRPDQTVVSWMTSQDTGQLFVSAITLGELHYGAALLPQGAKRRSLEKWVEDLEHRFAGRIIVLDDAVASRWGKLQAIHPNIPVVDAQIAATALAFGMTFVTRNVKDFRIKGLTVINPWDR